MKKQINPTIKAQVIRSAFYLLLLLAVCVIPFALAQRNAAKRAVVNSPGVPVASYHGTKAPTFHVLPLPKVPNDVLYDQYNNPSTSATSSQDFETANDAFDDFTADDFVVPSGETWNINEVDVQGTYDGFPGPALAFHVFFYTDCAGLPGTQVYSAMNQPYTTSNNIDFVVNLSSPAVLGPGTYWVSVQCRMDFDVGGQWYWQNRTVTSNSPAAWENPAGGFGVGCITWAPRTGCADDAAAPDQVYRLVGTIGGSATPAPTCAAPTPTPTPTGTPIPCGTYTTSTSTGNSIVPGDTDTGNHIDDGYTAVTLPFSVSLYGQIYNTLYVGSNGALDVTGPDGGFDPFTHGCVLLPSSNWTTTILAYQDDLQTDVGLSGCSTWTNGCGVFTATTGTAPNRTFYIEWHAVHFLDNTAAADFEIAFYENNAGIFDTIYGATSDNGSDETSGVQASSTGHATTFSCGAATLTNGLKVTYTCAVPTPTPTPPCGEPGAWSFVAPYPETLESAAIATDGTFAYGAGGDFNAVPTNGFYRYDPVADSWSTLAPLPQALFDARSAYAANVNKVYVFGGVDASGSVINTNYVYDVASGTWSTGAPMPDARFFPGVAYYSGNGKIYVIGGVDSSFFEQGQVWEYDPCANTWDTSRTADPIVQGGSSTSIVCQFIYLAGRFGNAAGETTHQRYDILNDSWASMAPVPVGVYAPAGAAVGNTTYTMGGGNPFAGGSPVKLKQKQDRISAMIKAPATSYNLTWVYDIASDTWFVGPNLGDAHSFTGGTAIGNSLLVVAGFNGSTGDTNEVEMSAVSNPCTIPCSPPPTPTPCGPTATPTATATATTPPPTPTATATATTPPPTPTATPTVSPRPTPTPRPRPTPPPRP